MEDETVRVTKPLPGPGFFTRGRLLAVALVLTLVALSAFMFASRVPLQLTVVSLGLVAVFGGYCLFCLNRLQQGMGRARDRLNLLAEMEDNRNIGAAVEDEEGNVVYANARFREWFPACENGLIGAVAEGLSGNASVTPDVLIKMRMRALKGRKGREEISNGQRGNDLWYEVSVVPMDNGMLSWQFREATERRRQIERAGSRLDLLSRALEGAPFGIVMLDDAMKVVEVNKAFRSIVNGQPVAGKSFMDLIDPDDHATVTAYFDLCRSEDGHGPANGVDARVANIADCTITINAVRAVTTRDPEPGFLVHVLDVTERKQLETQFAQSQKMQAVGQLAGGVAHDFNNMLTAMIGFCDLLLQRHQPGDPSFADTMQIKQNANRAAGLVRQLLAFSRQQRVQPRILSVTDVLAELSMLLRRLLGETIDLEMIHGRELGRVKMDQVQLEQVIINLAVNARDAMPHGGKLIIQTDNFAAGKPYQLRGETMPPGDYVMISVTDTGIGIEKEDMDHIFEPFFTTKDVGQGTGLGLSMVFGSIRQAGGFVVAHSAGKGKGASFILYLKRVADEEVQAADVEADTDPGVADVTGGGRILLVEDEDAVRLFAARALRSKGYKVVEARTGESALEILDGEEGDFDLLVTDMMMPRVDGVTVIKHARKKTPSLPVICISGYTQDALAKEVADLPRLHFLPKPFSLKQLAGKVKGAMESGGDSPTGRV